MKLFAQLFVLGLAVEVTAASSWFSKSGQLLPFEHPNLPACQPLRALGGGKLQASLHV
jgi:hypothetical protein